MPAALANADSDEVPNPAVSDRIVDKIPGTSDPKGKWRVIPPAPIPLDWQSDAPLEHAIEATHIKFDHKAGGSSDALNIRWIKDIDLDHKGDGAGVGEYVPELKRNEPIAYVCTRQYTIKVRFEAKLGGNPSQVLDSAMIRAAANSVDLGCLEMVKKKVNFSGGVSIGSDGSEYVEFTTTSPMINWISNNAVWFRFHAEKLLDAGGLPCDDESPDVLVDQTSRIDVYTVLDDPGHPWYTQGEKSEPWVSALHFAIYTCNTYDQRQVLNANYYIVTHLFSEHWQGSFFVPVGTRVSSFMIGRHDAVAALLCDAA
ncbi:MAG: hypothetical protein K8I27_06815 [Planctomycetes bacterium]|nr:hypothetical protein [Planctomycetota bacterium]